MRTHPAGAGCDDPVRRLGTAGRVLRWQALSSYPSSVPVRKAFAADAWRPETTRYGLKRPLYRLSGGCPVWGKVAPNRAIWHHIGPSGATSRHSADLASEAAETLRSVRSGGPGPNGEAAVTRDRRDRERPAVRLAVGADVCGAAGCRRTDGLLVVPTVHGRRVLCPLHARGVRQ